MAVQMYCMQAQPRRAFDTSRGEREREKKKNALRVHNNRRRRVTKATIHYIQRVRWYNWRRREEFSLFFSRERVAGAAAAAAAPAGAAFRHFLSSPPLPFLGHAMRKEKES